MQDHVADVKKYAKGPVEEAAVAGLLKTYRLVLSKADTRYVACSDPAERQRVRKSFLEKKLGLTGDDLDQAIEAVCGAMKADRTKSRLTFYYLLAERFGKLAQFALAGGSEDCDRHRCRGSLFPIVSPLHAPDDIGLKPRSCDGLATWKLAWRDSRMATDRHVAAAAGRRPFPHRRRDRDLPDLPRRARPAVVRRVRPAQGRGRDRGAAALLSALSRRWRAGPAPASCSRARPGGRAATGASGWATRPRRWPQRIARPWRSVPSCGAAAAARPWCSAAASGRAATATVPSALMEGKEARGLSRRADRGPGRGRGRDGDRDHDDPCRRGSGHRARGRRRRACRSRSRSRVETDGRLPSGQALGEAIADVDAATDAAPAYYMVNCAHPTHFADKLRGGRRLDRARARPAGQRVALQPCRARRGDRARRRRSGGVRAQYAELRRLLPSCGARRLLRHRPSPCRGHRARLTAEPGR